ncbi:MAG: hypothetical protein DMF20_05045 [Verrucomicrobia bacterium]|nr:MAG: hypothetical protein DMF20_05045 [Verrucomicrobiota bacterium]
MGDNGTSSAEQLLPDALSTAAARFVDSLKINSISEAVRRGRPVVIKRRHVYGEQLTELANLYFRIAGLPIRFWTKTEDWQRWEVECFKMLNGDRFHVSSHAHPPDGGSSWNRIPTSTPVLEQRLPRFLVSRRRRHGQRDL